MPLKECDCCGFVPPFSRNLQKLNHQYVNNMEMKKHKSEYLEEFLEKCTCPKACPICNPWKKSFGLMWVGKSFYSPSEFIKEAEKMGISKRIPQLPRWITLGETWILLAHQKVREGISLEQIKSNGLIKDTKESPAIFYAFKPQRIEMPVWKDDISDEEILFLEKKGITPVLIEKTKENQEKHGRAKNREYLRKLFKSFIQEKSE
jgi:hypothetical protein